MKHPLKIVALHEAAHCLIAKLFEDCFVVKTVTLNAKSKYKHIPAAKNWGGVNDIDFKKHNKPEPFAIDALIITNWAGFVGQNIGYLGYESMSIRKHHFILEANSYDTRGIENDYAVISRHAAFQAASKRLTATAYQQFCLQLLVDFFIEEKAWLYVIRFADELMKSKDKTLTKRKINRVFRQSGYNKFLREKRSRFLSKYFKLSFKQKLYYYFKTLL